ncbi:MAG TPA: 50S ribosomal protein L31e [archaeon]|nr:50S ribosomal protein L31e [archaeon]
MEEKIITINIRKKVLESPKWRRSSHAAKILTDILKKRLKTEVKLSKEINEKIWSRGMKNPVTKLRIKIMKVDEKTSKAELA